MHIVKGTNGYIRRKKRMQLLITLVILFVSIGLFVAGYLTTKSTKNLLTVFAVLGALPGAKSLVNLILFLPYKSFDADSYRELEDKASEKALLYSDLVFTSSKHIMHLDTLYVCGKELVALALNAKEKNQEDIIPYFTDSLKKRGVTVHMHIFHSVQEFGDRISSLADRDEAIPEEITEFIRMILV